MATKTLSCKLRHEWGQKVQVGSGLYQIGKDGTVEVDEAHAVILLQNKDKWEDPSAVKAPMKRPKAASSVILVDPATGQEVDAPIGGAEGEGEGEGEGDGEGEQDGSPPEEGEKVGGEPPPPEWPEVSTDNTKTELLDVLEKIQAAGHEVEFNAKMNKADLLEVIERAYDAME